jgi:hypothetical protein
MRTYIFASHRRYLATDKSNNTTTETSTATEPQSEIGPSAPELQIHNLTGDHERK